MACIVASMSEGMEWASMVACTVEDMVRCWQKYLKLWVFRRNNHESAWDAFFGKRDASTWMGLCLDARTD